MPAPRLFCVGAWDSRHLFSKHLDDQDVSQGIVSQEVWWRHSSSGAEGQVGHFASSVRKWRARVAGAELLLFLRSQGPCLGTNAASVNLMWEAPSRRAQALPS